MELHFEGLFTGIATFIIIGLFHPVVIKMEYYWGTRFWWVLLFCGLVAACAALFIADTLWSAACGVFAFSSFWGIKELFEQRRRVEKGWFPRNPNRKQQQ